MKSCYQNTVKITYKDISKFDPLIKSLAIRYSSISKHKFEFEDIVQIATEGVIKSLQSLQQEGYTPAEKMSYIQNKTTWFVQDWIRKQDHVNYNQRVLINKINSLLQHNKTPQEICGILGLDIDTYFQLVNESCFNQMSIDSINEADSSFFENSHVKTEELLDLQSVCIEMGKLTDKQQLVMSLIYVEECSFKDVSEILDVSVARVSQIHSECVAKLKQALKLK